MPVEEQSSLGREISVEKAMIEHDSETTAGPESDVNEFPKLTLSPTQPYPRIRRTDRRTSVPRAVTLQENYTIERQRQRTLERTQSISMTNGPRRVDASARMAGEFRYESARLVG